jgi:hypothetical protein
MMRADDPHMIHPDTFTLDGDRLIIEGHRPGGHHTMVAVDLADDNDALRLVTAVAVVARELLEPQHVHLDRSHEGAA